MGKLKKLGIGLGIIVLIFVVLLIVSVVWYNSLDPIDREKYDAQNKEHKELEKQLELDTKNIEVSKNSELGEKTKQLTKSDYEILDSKKQIGFYEEAQLDVWSIDSFFYDNDRTKEQILADAISRLEKIIPENIEELEYLKDDLKLVNSEFERSSIKSQIEDYESTIFYDKQKLSDLKTDGISVFEEYAQTENQEQINKYLERIQRLETLKNKNLDYLNTDKLVFQYVSNYKGDDNKGNTLQNEVELFIKEKYGHDALTDNNPFLKDNWIKTNTISYFGTESSDTFNLMQERYKVVRYAFFYPLAGEYKTILGFGFDTETYKIVADNEDSKDIINKLKI